MNNTAAHAYVLMKLKMDFTWVHFTYSRSETCNGASEHDLKRKYARTPRKPMIIRPAILHSDVRRGDQAAMGVFHTTFVVLCRTWFERMLYIKRSKAAGNEHA